MSMITALLSLNVAIGECLPPKPNHPSSPVGASAPALGLVSIEIPLVGPIPEPDEILETLDARGIKATLLVSKDWTHRHAEFLKNASSNGHEIGIWLSLKNDVGMSGEFAQEPKLADWVAALRQSRKVIRTTTGQTARTVAMSLLPNLGETAAEAMAFRAILPNERTVGDLPRRVEKVDKTKGRARVIGQGRYDDGCGHLLPHWSPAGLDRATHAAARAEWIRIGLPSAEGVGPMLGQWLDTVVIPHKWHIVTASQMAKSDQKAKDRPPRTPPPVAVAKRISPDQWRAVAEAIADSSTLPQYPTTDVNLTEAFYGLVKWAASDLPLMPITLGHLNPPTVGADRELTETMEFSREQVSEMATILKDRLKGQVPSIISIGTHSVTAAEALQLLALYVLNRPLISTAVSNPKPLSPDCGWGASVGL